MLKIRIGKIKEQLENKRGWLVGQFMDIPEFRDDNVEIYYKVFPVGDAGDKLHYHPQGREYLIVLAGKAKMRIGDEIVTLSEGDYIAVANNTPDQILEVSEALTIIGVRYPSLPDNKIFLENT